ncbi:FCD domain-containing protein [Pusillimonas sp. TS35]|jgi:DNA-binding GntR family transcriptional regulator|uniref:GntR family transcriptional regulator n=1 Tax=Paracandidimonas lactea TaxID=2895524 RepID=UPI00136B4758|nr:GntR family transcriptional regulator [Paracandidimonas lactea]MYN11732.1 FCD domain-containing protein [Pusillimonas sp. TS35]
MAKTQSDAPGPEATARSGDTVERVAALLKEQILDGTLAPGQRLISRDLVEQLGISRGPLREAFHRLAGDRLVTLVPNRGAVVRRLSRDEVVSLFQIREALEGQAARLAARNIGGTGNRALLEAMLEEGKDLALRLDMRRFITYNRAFHQAVVQVSGNQELAMLIDRYQLAVFMTQLKRVVGADAIIKTSIAQHDAIARAILAGDAEAAYAAMSSHLWHSATTMLEREALQAPRRLRRA